MGVAINVKSQEEVPEIMRKFVTESDGGFDYDFNKTFKALKEEQYNNKIFQEINSALRTFSALRAFMYADRNVSFTFSGSLTPFIKRSGEVASDETTTTLPIPNKR